MKSATVIHTFQNAVNDVKKDVMIEIDLDDLTNLKKSKYKLCFAKKVGDNDYNVVWQSYNDFLHSNSFSWIPQYSLFGSNYFQDGIEVRVDTNIVAIQLNQISTLNEYGVLQPAVTGGPETCFTLDNEYGPIHPGVNQLSTGIDGQSISTPIYVATEQALKGSTQLTPVEKVLVWFEQNIETSTMFSNSKSKSIEIDLTHTNSQNCLYKNGDWSVT